MLAVAAGFIALPALASGQDMSGDMKMMHKDSSLAPKPVPPSDGTTCPWGCPSSTGAAGLTGPQFLALQQELRDRKCGTNHVTGRLRRRDKNRNQNVRQEIGRRKQCGRSARCDGRRLLGERHQHHWKRIAVDRSR